MAGTAAARKAAETGSSNFFMAQSSIKDALP
jgi:hypothetical protein